MKLNVRVGAVITLSMLLLIGALSLSKNGGGPVPPTPWSNGGGPVPPTPWK